MIKRLVHGELPLIQAEGAQHSCVYLPGQLARFAYLYPRRRLTRTELDEQLAAGRRRSGPYLYYTSCLQCRACQPTRVPVGRFAWTRSMRRVENRGDRLITTKFGAASADAERVELYNRHRLERGLADTAVVEAQEYREFLIETCCITQELSFYDGDRIIGCNILDVGERGLSAVYTHYDPAYAKWSIGTYAVLKLLRLAASLEMDYVYLGLYVAANEHLNYKARFLPQERLIGGRWIVFDDDACPRAEAAEAEARPVQDQLLSNGLAYKTNPPNQTLR